jgi:uncharacterized phiE125 gp8 family phage protein
MALDTLANVKTSLLITGSTDDAVLNRLIDAADAFIAEYTGRAFAGGSFTEVHAAGREVVFLRNFPVASVTSVKVDAARQFGSSTVLPVDNYVVHTDRGVIESLNGPFIEPRPGRTDDWPAAVQVVYSAPTGQVPAAVREAFCQLIGHWYRAAKSAAGQNFEMLTRRVESSVEKEWPWSLAAGEPLPPGVLQMLEPYRVPAA